MVDANTVPIVMGDVWITFAASLVIPGKVVYLHPVHNYAFVSYDPVLIGETPARSATLSTEPLDQGDDVHLIGLYKPHVPGLFSVCVSFLLAVFFISLCSFFVTVSRKTNVTKIRDVSLRECNPPRYRATNIEGIEIDDPVTCQGGVLANDKGAVQGLWVSFSFQDSEGGENPVVFLLSFAPVSLFFHFSFFISDFLQRIPSFTSVSPLKSSGQFLKRFAKANFLSFAPWRLS